MAMPASGCIAIKDNTIQTCSSIDCAVTSCASGSLCALSVAASKTAPHCMTEFYSYSSGSAICICMGTATVCSSGPYICDIWMPICFYGRVSGDVITVCFNAGQNLSATQCSCYWYEENSHGWYTCGATPTSFTRTGIDYDDTLSIRIMICETDKVATIGDVSICLSSTPAVFTTGSGTITRCSPYNCYAGVGFM